MFLEFYYYLINSCDVVILNIYYKCGLIVIIHVWIT